MGLFDYLEDKVLKYQRDKKKAHFRQTREAKEKKKPRERDWIAVEVEHLFDSKNKEQGTVTNPNSRILWKNKRTGDMKLTELKGHWTLKAVKAME